MWGRKKAAAPTGAASKAAFQAIIDHPVIGPVIVAKSRRARRISISVRPPDRMRLAVPWGVSVADAMAFLESKTDWIVAAKARVAARVQPGEAIDPATIEAWRAAAREKLPPRVEELARLHGLRYRSVSVRNARTRWGSCSARDDISLSIRLMRLPDELIDYIILHELCHTVHKNHGPRFHALLDRLTGGRHAALRRQILKYR
jgi:predicted metal-dependent hydrolase